MLTQLSTIKTRLGIAAADTADDAILSNAIAAASERFARHCNRIFERTENAVFEFNADEREIVPLHYPIESVAGFDLKTSEADGWETQSNTVYLIRKGVDGACVISLSAPLGARYELARVTLTGGYVLPGATPEDGQMALPDDVEQACVEQVAYWYQRRHQLGLVSMAAERGSIHQFAQLDLLPGVNAALSAHKRYRL